MLFRTFCIPLALAMATLLSGCCHNMVTSSRMNPADPCLPGSTYYLPKVYMKIAAKGSTFTLTQLPPVADQAQAYTFTNNHEPWREDGITIGTDAQGLLTNVTANSIDQTGQIAVALADIVMAFYNPLSAAMPLTRGSGEPEYKEIIFDPTDCEAVKRASECTGVKICVKPLQPVAHNANVETEAHVEGIVYRRPVPYEITLQSEDKSITKREIALIPNKGPIGVLPLQAGGLVETKYEMNFINGSLTKYSATKPSEILGFVRIPGRLIRSFLTLDYQRRDYETKLLQQQITLMTEEGKLKALQNK